MAVVEDRVVSEPMRYHVRLARAMAAPTWLRLGSNWTRCQWRDVPVIALRASIIEDFDEVQKRFGSGYTIEAWVASRLARQRASQREAERWRNVRDRARLKKLRVSRPAPVFRFVTLWCPRCARFWEVPEGITKCRWSHTMTDEQQNAPTDPAPADPDATLETPVACPECGLPSEASQEAGWRVCSGLHRFQWPAP